MARHQPQPSDPGWTHPDVRGMTDPAATRALLRALEIQGQQERDRVAREAVERQQEQQRRAGQ